MVLLPESARRGNEVTNGDRVQPRSVISGILLDVDEICALMGFYAACNCNCNSIPEFRDKLSVRLSRVKHSNKNAGPSKMGPVCCPETSVRDDNYTLRQIAELRRSLLTRNFDRSRLEL